MVRPSRPSEESSGPILHPLFFAVGPVMVIGVANLNEVSVSEIALQSLALASCAAALWLAAWLALRDIERSALVVTLSLVFIFAWGGVAGLLAPTRDAAELRGSEVSGLWWTWCAIWLVGVLLLLRSRGAPRWLTRFANLTGAALVAIQVVLIAEYSLNVRDLSPDFNEAMDPGPRLAAHSEPDERPDIYFFIPDRYGSAKTLEGYYGFDNREFLEALESRGFWIGTDSRANYFFTPQSMASSLNMTHLGFLGDLGIRGADLRPLYRMIRDNRLTHYLKSLGYTYVHSGSWWAGTRRNPLADINVESCLAQSLLDPLIAASVLSPLLPAVASHRVFCHLTWSLYESVPRQIEAVAEVAALEGPTFTLAHFLVPHEPWVFDRGGAFVTEEVARQRTAKENYTQQLIHTNTLLLQLVDSLLARSESPPIIVIHADEGPLPESLKSFHEAATAPQSREGALLDLTLKEDLGYKFGVLAAIYAPEADTGTLSPSMTPVNTWRWILNQYFGQELSLLPERSFVFMDTEEIYRLLDVTESIAPSGSGR
jgi:hypothetical protein